MRAVWLRPLFIFAISVLASGDLFAQPLFPKTESIDSLVANSDYILVATLVDFRTGAEADDHSGYDVTIVIDESLKQPVLTEVHPRMSFHFPHLASVLNDWKERSSRLLVAYDEFAPTETKVIELAPGKVEVMTADFVLLRQPDAIIKAARQMARGLPVGVKRVQTFNLHVPRAIVAGTKWEPYYDIGGHLVLSVPVDEQLKKRAREYLRSKENRLKHSEGEQALRYFKADQN
ncbi:hypothetical protein [Aureliella helgolandensis]|uniref:Uncharacterized protein n=1 Tax=Aureliella helgolandensis TaxID=2527968 RepID=A0A518G1S8_9BACT|nr:hypothetical protein [Aureliella helgolandensis]QDV22534.1 hypothetical protein Q31a_08200 [Aureliella helgolandensis]